MNNNTLLVIIAGWALCGSPTARSETFHVAQRHPAAADENPGTLEQPWQTIGRSLKTLRAGQTIMVHEGDYRETVMMRSHRWTFDGVTYEPVEGGRSIVEPVRFIARPGDTVAIKGSDLVTGWRRHDGDIWLREHWPHNSQQVFSDGTLLQQIGGIMTPGLMQYWRGEFRNQGFENMMAGSFYYDLEAERLYVWLPDGGDPNRHEMEAGVRPFVFSIHGELQYIHVSGFKMMHGNVGSKVNWAAVGISGSHIVFEDCEFVWNDYIAVSLHGHNNILRRCELSHNGNAGMTGSGWGNQVLDSRLAWNNHRRWSAGWGAGGMKIIPYAHGWIVSGCIAEHNLWSDGIWFDAHNTQVVIQNNILRYNDGSGIHYEISDRALIRNNVAYENRGRGIYLSNAADSMVLHNICWRNGMSGIVVHGVNRPGHWRADAETGYEPARNNVVLGNILVDNCHPDLAPDQPDHTGRPWTERPELIMPDPRIASNRGGFSNFNIFHRSDGRPIPFWENYAAGVYADLAEWSARTGNDRQSRIVEPLFVDVEARDFRPARGSPAIQFVRSDSNIYLDADGRQRPVWEQVFLTAGAFEAPAAWRTRPEPPPATAEVLHPVPLPAQAVALADTHLDARLAQALAALPRVDLPGGTAGIELQGLPFALDEMPRAVVLDRNTPRSLMPVNRMAQELSVLLAVSGAGDGPLARCVIMRQDGRVIPLHWVAGHNIANSLGPWDGTIEAEEPPEDIRGHHRPRRREPSRTQTAWQGEVDGRPVRLFLTTWQNQNEWLPVGAMDWFLDDPNATVMILGLTVRTGQ